MADNSTYQAIIRTPVPNGTKTSFKTILVWAANCDGTIVGHVLPEDGSAALVPVTDIPGFVQYQELVPSSF